MNQITGHTTQLLHLKSLRESGRVPHSLLFTGPDGIGKYTTARYFAKSMLCTSEHPPCGTCAKCQAFEAHRLMDVIELGNGVDAVKVGKPDEPGTVRHLIARLSERSVSGGFIVIINGMERINESGQNILLKTVEEPGENTRIIMTAPSKSSVLQTIRSRSVLLDFFPLSCEQICEILDIEPESNSAEEAAIIASGGSVSLAAALMEDELILQILETAAALASSIKHRTALFFDDRAFEALAKTLPLIDVLIHLFRYMLHVVVNNQLKYNVLLEKLYIDDISSLHSLIKLLLQIKKETRFSVNIKNAVKSAAYTMQKGSNDGIYMY